MSAPCEVRYSARYSARPSGAEIDRRPETVEIDRRPETVDPPHVPAFTTLKQAAAGAGAPLPSMTRTRLTSCTGTNSSLKVDHRPRADAKEQQHR